MKTMKEKKIGVCSLTRNTSRGKKDVLELPSRGKKDVLELRDGD